MRLLQAMRRPDDTIEMYVEAMEDLVDRAFPHVQDEYKRHMLFHFALSGLDRQSTLIRYDSLWGTANIDDLLEKFETVLDARFDGTTHADVVKPTRTANVGVQANFPSDDESWYPRRHLEHRPRTYMDRRVEEESHSHDRRRGFGGRWRPYQER